MRHLWLSESGQCWRSFLVALILVIIVTQSCSRPFYTRMFHFSPQKPSRNSSVGKRVWKCVLCLIIDWYWSCNSWCLASHVHHLHQLDLLIDAILAGDRREGGRDAGAEFPSLMLCKLGQTWQQQAPSITELRGWTGTSASSNPLQSIQSTVLTRRNGAI